MGVAGNSKVWHEEGGTSGKCSVKLDWNFSRSAVRFFRKNAPLPFPSLAVSAALHLGKRAVMGEWESCRAVWDGAKTG